MKHLCTLLLLLSTSTAFAELKLIPTPRYVSQEGGIFLSFQFTANASIVLKNPDSEEDRFAANQIIEEAQSSLKLPLRLIKSADNPSIVIHNGGGMDIPSGKVDLLIPERLGLTIPEDASLKVINCSCHRIGSTCTQQRARGALTPYRRCGNSSARTP